MGIYLTNMEMPKSCGNCFFDTHCDKWRLRNWGAPPPDDCPLVSVPTPHGRLIDESALLKGCGYIIADGMACIPVKHIANAPTIIPAEEVNK